MEVYFFLENLFQKSELFVEAKIENLDNLNM